MPGSGASPGPNDASMVQALERLERKFEERVAGEREERRELQRVLGGLQSCLFGDAQNVGLVERLRTLERLSGIGQRVIWIIMVGVLGIFGNLVWSMAQAFMAAGAS